MDNLDKYDAAVRDYLKTRPELMKLINAKDREGLIAYLKSNPSEHDIFMQIFSQI